MSYVEEGERKRTVLDLVDMPMSHTGEQLADTLEKVLKDFGLEDKVSSVQFY